MAQNVIRKGIYLTPELMEELRDFAHANRLTESEVVRQALIEHFDPSYPVPVETEIAEDRMDDDPFTIGEEARLAITKLSAEKDVPVDKVVDAIIRKQIPKYFKG
jgi:hypothetical protein